MSDLGRRRMERFDLRLPAQIRVTGVDTNEEIQLQTRDICAGGAFFQTNVPLPVGTRVDLDLTLPLDELKKLQGKRARIVVTGAVVRCQEDGIAVCFEDNYKILPQPN